MLDDNAQWNNENVQKVSRRLTKSETCFVFKKKIKSTSKPQNESKISVPYISSFTVCQEIKHLINYRGLSTEGDFGSVIGRKPKIHLRKEWEG